MPIEPPSSRWQLDLDQATPKDDLVGVGADLEPGTLLMAYRAGLFPMGVGDDGGLGWRDQVEVSVLSHRLARLGQWFRENF